MENQKLVSVIIPIYNVEKYLDNCIKSVVNQTYKNLEIVLVDDGSPDNCPKMCDEWAKKDNRIKVIHKQNGGVSNTRNVGIENATGEYLIFVDSDDYLEKECISKAVKAIKNSDMVIFGYNEVGNKIRKSFYGKPGVYCFKKDEKVFFDLVKKGLSNQPWNKLYKKDKIVENFDKNFTIGEDCLFNLAYIKNVEKVAIIDDILYNYNIQNTGSILKTKIRSYDNFFNYWQKIFLFCNEYFGTETAKKDVNCFLLKSMRSQMLIEGRGISKKEFITIFDKYRNNEMVIDAFKNYSKFYECFKERVIFFLIKNKNKRILYYLRKFILKFRGKR